MQRPKIAERPLLQGKRETTPEMLTDGASDRPAPKFASLEDLSDSEEAEMDLSEDSEKDEEGDEESRPRKRRALAGDGAEDIPIPAPAPPPPQPKWSNPDPYTALPPPDESQHKRLDVVKLIRKAKLQYDLAEAKEKDAVAENEDFISLGAMDDLPESEKPPENAPKGPRSMQNDGAAAPSRKRQREEDQRGPPPKTGKPGAMNNWDGSIISQWKPFPGQNGTPWVTQYPQHPGTRYARYSPGCTAIYPLTSITGCTKRSLTFINGLDPSPLNNTSERTLFLDWTSFSGNDLNIHKSDRLARSRLACIYPLQILTVFSYPKHS